MKLYSQFRDPFLNVQSSTSLARSLPGMTTTTTSRLRTSFNRSFFLALPFPLFPLPLASAWCVLIFVILKCLIGIVSSLFPRFPRTELFQSFDFGLFTFFLWLWLLLLYCQRCFGDLGDNGLSVGIYGFYQFFQQSFFLTHPSCRRGTPGAVMATEGPLVHGYQRSNLFDVFYACWLIGKGILIVSTIKG